MGGVNARNSVTDYITQRNYDTVVIDDRWSPVLVRDVAEDLGISTSMAKRFMSRFISNSQQGKPLVMSREYYTELKKLHFTDPYVERYQAWLKRKEAADAKRAEKTVRE